MSKNQGADPTLPKPKECFVIMPIGVVGSVQYVRSARVFEDIIAPACTAAGFNAFRADQGEGTSLIHLEILKRLLKSPIAVCDLTDRNPNVLFELGFRQAFDMPVVLIQEEGTERIFDTAVLKTLDYGKGFDYRRVQEDQANLARAIEATHKPAADTINSLVRLLALTPAKLPESTSSGGNEGAAILQVVRAEIAALRQSVESLRESSMPGLIEELKLQRDPTTYMDPPCGEDLVVNPEKYHLELLRCIEHARTQRDIRNLELRWRNDVRRALGGQYKGSPVPVEFEVRIGQALELRRLRLLSGESKQQFPRDFGG